MPHLTRLFEAIRREWNVGSNVMIVGLEMLR